MKPPLVAACEDLTARWQRIADRVRQIDEGDWAASDAAFWEAQALDRCADELADVVAKHGDRGLIPPASAGDELAALAAKGVF